MRRSVLPVMVVVVAVVVAVAALIVAGLGSNAPANPILINDDVVVYEEGQAPFEVIECDSESVIVSSMDGLREGAILAAGVTDETPDGMLRRLGTAEEVPGGYRFATTQAALTEAIDKCDVSYTVSITEDGSYEVKDARTGVVSPFAQQAFADESLDGLFSWDKGFAKVYAGDEIDVSLRIDYGEISMRVVNRLNAGAEMDLGKLGGQAEKEWELFSKALRPFTFQVGVVPVVFTNNLTASLSVDGSVGFDVLSAEAVLDKSFGFEYTSANGLRAINEDNSKAPEFSFSEEADTALEADVEAELALRFESLLYGCAGPEFSVGLNSATDAKLQKLSEGEDADGAIVVPGLDWKLKGALNEKVTVPIKGEFKLTVPVNPFCSDAPEISAELFDTGDTITLLDISKEFGEFGRASTIAGGSSGSYTTKWAHTNMVTYPEFTFDLPNGWSVVSDDISQTSEYVTVESRNGVTVYFSHIQSVSGGVGGVYLSTKFEKIADSSFVPGVIQSTDHSSLGEFMVAKVMVDDAYRSYVGESFFDDVNLVSCYAVVPKSMEGEQTISGVLDLGLSFDYGGQISFHCVAPEGGLSKQDEAAVISMLSSFRVG